MHNVLSGMIFQFFLSLGFDWVHTSMNEELHMSAMQRYSMAAFKDGLDAPTITALASLANWGQHESNVERDFHRLIPCLYGSSFPTYDIAIDIYDPDAAAIKTIEVPVLLASTVLHELHKKDDKTLWSTCIGATAQKTYDFWTAFNTDRASQWSHPVFEQSGINQ